GVRQSERCAIKQRHCGRQPGPLSLMSKLHEFAKNSCGTDYSETADRHCYKLVTNAFSALKLGAESEGNPDLAFLGRRRGEQRPGEQEMRFESGAYGSNAAEAGAPQRSATRLAGLRLGIVNFGVIHEDRSPQRQRMILLLLVQISQGV